MRVVSEQEFAEAIRNTLAGVDVDCVMGPGRSGAVAAVYASHILGVPFLPYGAAIPAGYKLLIIDTARETGKTLRKIAKRYAAANPVVVAVYEEPPRVMFWYEAPKPQRYKKEKARVPLDISVYVVRSAEKMLARMKGK